MSLKQIAESLGYTDVYFFHRQFKSVAGVTPGQWRKPTPNPAEGMSPIK